MDFGDFMKFMKAPGAIMMGTWHCIYTYLSRVVRGSWLLYCFSDLRVSLEWGFQQFLRSAKSWNSLIGNPEIPHRSDLQNPEISSSVAQICNSNDFSDLQKPLQSINLQICKIPYKRSTDFSDLQNSLQKVCRSADFSDLQNSLPRGKSRREVNPAER